MVTQKPFSQGRSGPVAGDPVPDGLRDDIQAVGGPDLRKQAADDEQIGEWVDDDGTINCAPVSDNPLRRGTSQAWRRYLRTPVNAKSVVGLCPTPVKTCLFRLIQALLSLWTWPETPKKPLTRHFLFTANSPAKMFAFAWPTVLQWLLPPERFPVLFRSSLQKLQNSELFPIVA
jgi:hypothetical protein